MTAKTQRREEFFFNARKKMGAGSACFSNGWRNYFFDHESRESHESGEVLFARFVRFVIQLFSENLSLRSLQPVAVKNLPMFGTFAPLRLSGQLIAVALTGSIFVFRPQEV